jgi:hypothetical protein
VRSPQAFAPGLLTEQQACSCLTRSLSSLRRARKKGCGPPLVQIGGRFAIGSRIWTSTSKCIANRRRRGGQMRRRAPFLHKRGPILYFFWTDENGKRHEESLRTSDLEIAIGRYEQRQQEIRQGLIPTELANSTLEQASEAWLEHRRLWVARGSLKAEQSIARSLLRVLGSHTTLRVLADIRRFHEYQTARLQSGISPKSINNELQVLASILRLAQLWHRVEQHYQPLRVRRSDVPDALSRSECQRLLTVATRADPLAVASNVAVLALSTGLRAGEIKGLKLADLHLDETRPYLTVRCCNTKTDAGARRVALGRIPLWPCEGWLLERAYLGLIPPTTTCCP